MRTAGLSIRSKYDGVPKTRDNFKKAIDGILDDLSDTRLTQANVDFIKDRVFEAIVAFIDIEPENVLFRLGLRNGALEVLAYGELERLLSPFKDENRGAEDTESLYEKIY